MGDDSALLAQLIGSEPSRLAATEERDVDAGDCVLASEELDEVPRQVLKGADRMGLIAGEALRALVRGVMACAAVYLPVTARLSGGAKGPAGLVAGDGALKAMHEATLDIMWWVEGPSCILRSGGAKVATSLPVGLLRASPVELARLLAPFGDCDGMDTRRLTVRGAGFRHMGMDGAAQLLVKSAAVATRTPLEGARCCLSGRS
mmetsp:Transcript_45059/g.107064  ORF Transcript_45059/g.107064 Transcript_45059/m.107064 type:complete len:204 (-) Transcript_45059:817-1428(-)